MATTDHRSPSQSPASSGGDHDSDNDKKRKKQARPPSPSTPDHDDGTGILVQIFTVSSRGIQPCDIKGIVVHEERDTHVIYSYHGEEATGTHGFRPSGLKIAIASETGCFLEVIPSTSQTMPSNDTLICLDDGVSYYNQTRSKTMAYGGGIITVEYAVLTRAVEANIEIKLQLPSTGLKYPVSGFITVSQRHGISMIYVGPEDYVSMPKQLPITLPLSRSVLAVKLRETITFHGVLSIGSQQVNIYEKVNIPSFVSICKTAETPWIQENGFSCSTIVTLIRRNI